METSFYAIIPSCILDDTNIPDKLKLLYLRILARTDSNGICTTTNIEFAKLSGCTERTIQMCMKQLKDRKLLVTENILTPSGYITGRLIKIQNMVKEFSPYGEENFTTIGVKKISPIGEENFATNINNNIYNNKDSNIDIINNKEKKINKKKKSLEDIENAKKILNEFYHRRATTIWNPKENKALFDILSQTDDFESEATRIINFYNSGYKYYRHSILTLLNNWNSELDLANKYYHDQNNEYCGY